MIKKFEEYINEGIRDKMTPKSEEEVKSLLDKIISLKDKLRYIQEYKLQKFVTNDELKEMLLIRIHEFFHYSNENEYLFFSHKTRNIHGINMFDIEGGTVVGIDEECVIWKDDSMIEYESLSASELQDVVECFIEHIEDKEG